MAGVSHPPDNYRDSMESCELSGRAMDQETLDYFRRRELAERSAAKNAISEAARRAHQELAQGYAEKLRHN